MTRGQRSQFDPWFWYSFGNTPNIHLRLLVIYHIFRVILVFIVGLNCREYKACIWSKLVLYTGLHLCFLLSNNYNMCSSVSTKPPCLLICSNLPLKFYCCITLLIQTQHFCLFQIKKPLCISVDSLQTQLWKLSQSNCKTFVDTVVHGT